MTQDGGTASMSAQAKFVQVDDYSMEQKLSSLQGYLKDLRAAFPADLWPVEEAAPAEAFKRCSIYPGRVRVGRVNDRTIFAHLLRVDMSGGTCLKYYYGDTGEELSSGSTAFQKAQYEKWCNLLNQPQNSAGSSGGSWEKRVKTVVKCVMLEAKHFDGTISSDPLIPRLIRQNIRCTGVGYIPILPKPPASSSALPDAARSLASDGSDRTPVHPLGRTGTGNLGNIPIPASEGSGTKHWELKKTGGIAPIKKYTDILREVVPPGAWFTTQALTVDVAKIRGLKSWSSELHLCSGKVLFGQYRETSGPKAGMRVWATARHSGGKVLMMLIDDAYNEVHSPLTLSESIALERVFWLLAEGEQVAATREKWVARVFVCVKVALIDAGYLTGDIFHYHSQADHQSLKTLISKGLVRETHRPTPENTTPDISNVRPLSSRPQKVVKFKLGVTRLRQFADASVIPANHTSAEAVDIAHSLTDTSVNGHTEIPPSQETASHQVSTEERAQSFDETERSSKKRKLSMEDPLHLLNFVNQQTSADCAAKIALEEQVRILTAEKADQDAINSQLRAQVGRLEQEVDSLTVRNRDQGTQNNILTKRIEHLSALEDRNNVLEQLQDAHIKYCQPVILELMKRQQMSKGSDEELAMQHARAQYAATYGLEVSE